MHAKKKQSYHGTLQVLVYATNCCKVDLLIENPLKWKRDRNTLVRTRDIHKAVAQLNFAHGDMLYRAHFEANDNIYLSRTLSLIRHRQID